MKRLNKKGFSLVELLAVMVILGILMTTAISIYSKYRYKAIQDSYSMMSENAASAAEEYFMDHITEDYVEFKTLIKEEYLERTIDPTDSDKLCGGNVSKATTKKGTNGALDEIKLTVNVECDDFESCMIYPEKKKC